jgi:hypothetical protein
MDVPILAELSDESMRQTVWHEENDETARKLVSGHIKAAGNVGDAENHRAQSGRMPPTGLLESYVTE